jgi:hypothetical protein
VVTRKRSYLLSFRWNVILSFCLVPGALIPSARLQDVPTEQLMQIRKQVQEEAQYFNESFQQLRMAQS